MSLKDNLEQDAELKTVELDEAGPTVSIFYIDNSSQIKSTIFLLLVFIALHILAAWRSPDLLSVKQEYFDFNKTQGEVSVDLNIVLSSLLPTHKFVNVNGSILRDLSLSSGKLSLPVEFAIKNKFLKNQTFKNIMEDDTKTEELVFAEGSKESSSYKVLQADVKDFDTIQIDISIRTNATNISGFLFNWSFENLSAAKYKRVACLLTSFLIGYMLIFFCSFINLQTEAFTQIFCIIIGFVGILSSNPIALFLHSAKGTRISDSVAMAAFLALYRLFLLTQLEMIRANSTSPKIVWLIIFSFYFAFYSTVNAAAIYDRGNLILNFDTYINTILPTEKLLMETHASYAVICFIYIILALKQSNGYSTRRLYLFIFFIVLTIIATFVSEVLFPILNMFMYSILPSMIIISTHLTTAAFAIFFLHNGCDPNYVKMGNLNQKGESLDIDELSNNALLDDPGKDHNINDLNEDDDEEEEEEEEE